MKKKKSKTVTKKATKRPRYPSVSDKKRTSPRDPQPSAHFEFGRGEREPDVNVETSKEGIGDGFQTDSRPK